MPQNYLRLDARPLDGGPSGYLWEPYREWNSPQAESEFLYRPLLCCDLDLIWLSLLACSWNRNIKKKDNYTATTPNTWHFFEPPLTSKFQLPNNLNHLNPNSIVFSKKYATSSQPTIFHLSLVRCVAARSLLCWVWRPVCRPSPCRGAGPRRRWWRPSAPDLPRRRRGRRRRMWRWCKAPWARCDALETFPPRHQKSWVIFFQSWKMGETGGKESTLGKESLEIQLPSEDIRYLFWGAWEVNWQTCQCGEGSGFWRVLHPIGNLDPSLFNAAVGQSICCQPFMFMWPNSKSQEQQH